MKLEIKPTTEELVDAVRDFNRRLKAGGIPYRFPERHTPKWLPKINGRRIYQEYYLAVEGDSTVRGGYILKHQDFSFSGDIKTLAFYQLPISEGTVDKKYSLVGLQMLASALNRQPLLFGLGAGGYDEPVIKLQESMGWSTHTVPFYFRVNHPRRFLNNIVYLRRSKLNSLLLDVLGVTGVGYAAIKLLQFIRGKNKVRGEPASVKTIPEFSVWADDLWQRCDDKYALIAVRDCHTLNVLYPRDSRRFIRLKMTQGSRVIGWALVLDTEMSDHKQFGNMRVGSIVDCLALPNDAYSVIAMATRFLENRGVDLIVSNQSHEAWCTALENAGFIGGPSNFLFSAAPKLAQLLNPLEHTLTRVHLNRGDGDGPINL